MVISERNCLHRLFETQAEAQPGKKALVFKNEFLTYHELKMAA
jgi:non-ribosomal peptide synthetase component F